MSLRNRSQSEVIGVVVLTGVVVSLTVLVGILIIPDVVSNTSEPLIDLDAEATSNQVTVTHAGGDAVDTDDVLIVLRASSTEQHQLSSFTQDRGSDSTRFEAGDEWTRSHNTADERMEVLLVHEPSNAVLDRETIDVG